MTKTLSKLQIEGNTLKITKHIFKTCTANIIPNDERLNAFPLRSVTRYGCPLTVSIKHYTRSPSQCNKPRKRNKRQTKDWKGGNRTVSIDTHDCLCRKSQGIYK